LDLVLTQTCPGPPPAAGAAAIGVAELFTTGAVGAVAVGVAGAFAEAALLFQVFTPP